MFPVKPQQKQSLHDFQLRGLVGRELRFSLQPNWSPSAGSGSGFEADPDRAAAALSQKWL